MLSLTLAALATASFASLSNLHHHPMSNAPKPNIVLVHGAFANASGWGPVISILEKDGYQVTGVENPLASLEGDVTTTKRVIQAQSGPTVVVGHSYGGAVITAAGNHEKVSALVYVADRAPDAGEDFVALSAKFPTMPVRAGVQYTPFPVAGGEPGTDVDVDPDAFPHIFAAGVPIETTRFMAWFPAAVMTAPP